MSAQVSLEQSWKEALDAELNQPYFSRLTAFVKDEYRHHKIYPPGNQIFRALDTTPINQVKVVILGQDPYHGPGQANGLCFSVSDGIPIPPSLGNIFKEIQRDLGIPVPPSGNLEHWAHQGVLLLNATLTVRAGQAGSHQNRGWENFTDAVIGAVNSTAPHCVFMLWGNYAQKKANLPDAGRHLILQSPHPSPLSAHRGFIGNGHFSKANIWLAEKGLKPIEW